MPCSSSVATWVRCSSASIAPMRPAPGTATRRTAVTLAGSSNGSTSIRMKTRIPRMLAMMSRPPPDTSQRATRSATSRRRGVSRLRLRSRRRSSAEGAVSLEFADIEPAPFSSGFAIRLLKLRQLLLDDLVGQRNEAVLDDRLLTLQREDVLEELADERIERLVGGLVDVDVEEARQRILAGDHVLRAVVDAGSLFGGHGDGPHARGLVADAAVADRVLVLGDALHHRSTARLLLHRRLVVALAERGLLEVAIGADRLTGPGAGDARVAPLGDRLAAAGAALREDAVELLHGEALDGVVLV